MTRVVAAPPDGAALESDAALLAGNLARPSCGGAARGCSSWPTLPVIRPGAASGSYFGP